MRHEMNPSRPGEAPIRSGKRRIVRLRSTSVEHVVEVTISGGTVKVSPDSIKIHAGDSVRWHFHGVQPGESPDVKFISPACPLGPFASRSLGSHPDPMNPAKLVYTMIALNADETPAKYVYDAGVTVVDINSGSPVWIGVDPVIDNEGKPPG
jgi:hypothetical protein